MQPQLLIQGIIETGGEDLAVYTVPLHTLINIASVALINSSKNTVTANLIVTSDRGAKKIRIAPADMDLLGGQMYETTAPYSVGQNEKLIINCSEGNVLSYHITAQKFPAQPVPTERAQP